MSSRHTHPLQDEVDRLFDNAIRAAVVREASGIGEGYRALTSLHGSVQGHLSTAASADAISNNEWLLLLRVTSALKVLGFFFGGMYYGDWRDTLDIEALREDVFRDRGPLLERWNSYHPPLPATVVLERSPTIDATLRECMNTGWDGWIQRLDNALRAERGGDRPPIDPWTEALIEIHNLVHFGDHAQIPRLLSLDWPDPFDEYSNEYNQIGRYPDIPFDLTYWWNGIADGGFVRAALVVERSSKKGTLGNAIERHPYYREASPAEHADRIARFTSDAGWSAPAIVAYDAHSKPIGEWYRAPSLVIRHQRKLRYEIKHVPVIRALRASGNNNARNALRK